MNPATSNEGKYTFKALPMNNQNWNQAQDVEIVFIIDSDSERKTFRGKATLTGVVKNAK